MQKAKFSVLVASLVSLFALTACQPAPQEQRFILVNGQGSISAVPDQLTFSVNVEKRGKDSSHLKTSVIESSDSIIQSALQMGIDEQAIRSMAINLYPWNEYKDGRQIHRGFVVSRSIEFTLDDFDLYPALLDVVVANDVAGINGFGYQVSDQKLAYTQALRNAISDALQRAIIIADKGGFKIGEIMHVTEQSSYRAQPESMLRAKSMQSDSFMPGTNDIQAQVRVQFAIR